MSTSNITDILSTTIKILTALANDVPAAIKVIDIVLPALREGRNLTSAEWTELNALADKAAANLASDSTSTTSTS